MNIWFYLRRRSSLEFPVGFFFFEGIVMFSNKNEGGEVERLKDLGLSERVSWNSSFSSWLGLAEGDE